MVCAARGDMQSMRRDGGSLAERRAHRRVSLEARAELHDGAQVKSGRLLDLSLGGLGLASDAAPPVGSEVELRVDLAGGTVELLGEVVRSQPGILGFRFVRLDQRALTTILSAVARA